MRYDTAAWEYCRRASKRLIARAHRSEYLLACDTHSASVIYWTGPARAICNSVIRRWLCSTWVASGQLVPGRSNDGQRPASNHCPQLSTTVTLAIRPYTRPPGQLMIRPLSHRADRQTDSLHLSVVVNNDLMTCAH